MKLSLVWGTHWGSPLLDLGNVIGAGGFSYGFEDFVGDCHIWIQGCLFARAFGVRAALTPKDLKNGPKLPKHTHTQINPKPYKPYMNPINPINPKPSRSLYPGCKSEPKTYI